MIEIPFSSLVGIVAVLAGVVSMLFWQLIKLYEQQISELKKENSFLRQNIEDILQYAKEKAEKSRNRNKTDQEVS